MGAKPKVPGPVEPDEPTGRGSGAPVPVELEAPMVSERNVPATVAVAPSSTFRSILASRSFTRASGTDKGAGSISWATGPATGVAGIPASMGSKESSWVAAYGVSCRAHIRPTRINGTRVSRALRPQQWPIRPVRTRDIQVRHWVPRSPPWTEATRQVEQLFGQARRKNEPYL